MVLGVIAYIFISVLVVYAAAMLVMNRLTQRTTTDTVIAVFIISISQQVCTSWVLGLIHQLFALQLFLVNLVVSSLFIFVSHTGRSGLRGPFTLIPKTLSGLWCMTRRPEFMVLFILNLAVFIYALAKGIIFPPYSWDGVYFHLGMVGFMVQNGDLGFIPRYTFESYPRNIELSFLWNVIFMRHQLLANCGQIPFVILGTFASFGILRKAGCRRESSVFAALIFPLIPLVIHQATTAYLDIAIAACLLAGVNLLLVHRPRVADIFIAGLAFGLLVGGKGSGLTQAVGIALVWFILTARGIIRASGVKKLALMLLILIGSAAINGTYMYVRNWIVFDNPVYPYAITQAGKTIFDGPLTMSYISGPELLGKYYDEITSYPWLMRFYITWDDLIPYVNWDGRRSGYGPEFFIIILPAMLATMIIALFRKKWKVLFTFLLLIVPMVILYYLSWWNRYSLYFITAGLLGYAYIDGLFLVSTARGFFRVSLLALVIIGLFLNLPERTPGFAGWNYFLNRGPGYWHSSQFAVEKMRVGLFNKLYPYEIPGTTIMIDDTFNHYSPRMEGEVWVLWNLDFSNKVVYSTTRGKGMWMKTLDGSGADYLLVKQDGISAKWAGELGDRLTPLFTSDGYIFFEVKEGADG